MKNFLGTFLIILILCWIFLFFGGFLIFEHIWALVFLIAFAISVLITAFLHQESRIEDLETRLKALESPEQPED